MDEMYNPDAHLPLSPTVYHILLTLAGGTRHGYAIMTEIAQRTNNNAGFSLTTLYKTIHRLLEDGLVEDVDAPPQIEAAFGERRRYYRLTPLGERTLDAEAQRMDALVQAVRLVRPWSVPLQEARSA